MFSYGRIFENNLRWAQARRREDPEYFSKLARGQQPEYLYVGCSDSRVPAEEIMGAQPGEVFVHRNIGNVVAGADLNAPAVIEFAVIHLEVKHIVVCGHYGCRGVQAAMAAAISGQALNSWVQNIREVYRLHRAELDGMQEDRRYERLVELNVLAQSSHVFNLPAVQQANRERGFPAVHGWVFDVRTGLIRDLDAKSLPEACSG